MFPKDIYHKGYSVLPALQKLGNQPIFSIDQDYDWYIQSKGEATHRCFLESEINASTYDTVCGFISEQTGRKGDFRSQVMGLQEDVAIHRVDGDRDWLAACCVCFPSGWSPEEKIGKKLEEIHAPIPGMNLRNSLQLAKSMVFGGPFVRFVWSVVFEKKLNGHPDQAKKQFDPSNPQMWIKIERQVTYGFPEISAALFVLRHHFVEEIDKGILFKVLSEMTLEQRQYKGISNELLEYLCLR